MENLENNDHELQHEALDFALSSDRLLFRVAGLDSLTPGDCGSRNPRGGRDTVQHQTREGEGKKERKKKSVAITDSNEAIPYLIIIKCTAMNFLEYISRCLFESLVDI